MQIEVEDADSSISRQALPRVVERTGSAVIEVASAALAASFNRFLTEVGEMLDSAPSAIGPFVMDELELSVSIAATGDFKIASSTGVGALKMTLRRPSSAQPPSTG